MSTMDDKYRPTVVNPKTHPLLAMALDSGFVWVEDREYLIRDTDGVVCSVGTVSLVSWGTPGFEDTAEAMLDEMPEFDRGTGGAR